MSSTTMSTAHLQPARHALPLSDKDTPSYPDSRRTASPPSPSSTPTPKLASSIPDKSEKPSSPTSPKAKNVESDEKDNTKGKPQDEIIEMETFQQIIDLDEDDDREFSIGMVEAYFLQASQTFEDMDTALTNKNLEQLSSLGHFLKGSSAALGVSKVKDSCEKIQHYGQCRDEELDKDLTKAEALDLIEKLLVQVKEDYAVAERWLKNWLAGDD